MRYLISLTLVVMLSTLGSGPASASKLIRAKGTFTVEIDFTTLTLTPVNENCLITVEGKIIFEGTLEGIANARTRALALASCDVVSTSPPGAYEDVFTSAFEFAGKVDGQPTVADFTYRGSTALGGEIDAILVPSNGLIGRLHVDAIVAVGGSYNGFLKAVNH